MKIVQKNSDTSKKSAGRGQSSGHTSKTLLSVKEAAFFLSKSEQTITNWCKEGKIHALPRGFGTKMTFAIPREECWRIRILLEEKQKEKLYKETTRKKPTHNHKDLIDLWIRYCEQGMLVNRKPFSPLTAKSYRLYLTKFLNTHLEASYVTLKSELINIPKENFGKRDGIFRSVCCFYNFLVQEGLGAKEEYERLKSLRPKRFLPPKKHSISEDQLNQVIAACKNSYERALIVLLANTGIRNAELRALRRYDIQLEPKILVVQLGKGNKPRKIGLNQASIRALEAYLEEYTKEPTDYLFTRMVQGEEMQHSPYSLIQKLKTISKRESIDLSPHALRRTFVTINANKGRSLVTLQILCGHADLETTRGYCMTSQADAVAQSQSWND
jgi:integrase